MRLLCRILTDVEIAISRTAVFQAALVGRTAIAHRAWGSRNRWIDDGHHDAFGQRQVSTMYTPLNQYHVVMEAAPQVLARLPTSLSQPRRALD